MHNAACNGVCTGVLKFFLGWRQHFGAKIQLGTAYIVQKRLSAIRKVVVTIIYFNDNS